MKPICDLCKKVGDDKYYYWLADKRGKGGKLCHMSCVTDILVSSNNLGRGFPKGFKTGRLYIDIR